MRKPIIAGNWKMHKTVAEAIQLVRDLAVLTQGITAVEIVVCPPFTALAPVCDALRGSGIACGAQDMHWEEQGAFTGEISPVMLREIGCRYVIIGHSERRRYFGETDASVNKKVKAALAHSLIPIVCVGETAREREEEQTENVVRRQTAGALTGLSSGQAGKIIIAYEPVWAIGTGKAATAEDANAVAGYIRRIISEMFDASVAQAVRIQYGGSVKPGNIAEFMTRPEIDGALVGGASLEAESFAALLRF